MRTILTAIFTILMCSCISGQIPKGITSENHNGTMDSAKVVMSMTTEAAKTFYGNVLPEFELNIDKDGRKASGTFSRQDTVYLSSVMIETEGPETVTATISLKDEDQANTLTIENLPLSPGKTTSFDFSIFLSNGTFTITIDPEFDCILTDNITLTSA